MGLLSKSVFNSEGNCNECELTVSKDETLQCDVWKIHTMCSARDFIQEENIALNVPKGIDSTHCNLVNIYAFSIM